MKAGTLIETQLWGSNVWSEPASMHGESCGNKVGSLTDRDVGLVVCATSVRGWYSICSTGCIGWVGAVREAR